MLRSIDDTTSPDQVEPFALSVAAWELLMDLLQQRGNTLSGQHAVALLKLTELLARYAAGQAHGRKAFPLPTGMGKTTGIVAFIAAAHRKGYRIPMSVAASQVRALVELKRELVALGVPEEHIGLAHRDPSAEEPSTGCRPEDGRLIQLVTHARVRMGDDYFGLFAEYRGRPRSLLVYDEALFRADAFAFLALTLESAVNAFMPFTRDRIDLGPVADYLTASVSTINEALGRAAQRGDHRGNPVELPEVHENVLALWKQQIASTLLARPLVSALQQFLDVCQLPLQALPMTQGGGAVAVRQAVSHQLDRVMVLDASAPIRDLLRMDPTIELYAPIPADLKSFEQVEVMQLLAAGGRGAIEQGFSEQRRETSAVSREVVSIVRGELAVDPSRCFLVFTFKQSSSKAVDVKAALLADLKAAGLDPEEEVIVDGQPRLRFAFLHWGQHEGLNGFEYCRTVILAGVLHRSHLDIAAHIKAQKLDLGAPTPNEEVTKTIKSEVAHCVYQAASRGSCRRVTAGKANPMRLWLIHADRALKDVLDPVMPNARWSYPEPKFLKRSAAGQQGVLMRGRILEALRGLGEEVCKVSTRDLKDRMGLSKDEATKKAFTRALQGLDLAAHGWRLEKQSLVRGALAHGFTAQHVRGQSSLAA